MKIAICISLSILVFASSMSNMALAVFFKVNQNQIATAYCVNKFKPEKKCEGKCFFKNIFEKKNDSNQKSSRPNIEDNFKINLFPTLFACCIESNLDLKNDPVFLPNQFTFQSFSPALLRPPIGHSHPA